MANVTVYMLGGTSESNLAAGHLESEGYRVVMSVATALGAELAVVESTEVGSRDAAGLAQSAGEAGAAAIVDCTHPFAEEASRAARAAAGLIKVPYLRFTRPEKPFQGAHIGHLQGWPQAVDYLKQKQGRALLTIGVRRLHLFAAAGLDFAVRVLPNQDSLDRCLELGIGQADIIAAQPPHSVKFNRECIRRSGASVLVSKDSGREGGLTEKAEAAGAEGIELLLIDRPRETGALTDLDELVVALAESIAPPAVRTKTGNDVYNDSHSE